MWARAHAPCSGGLKKPSVNPLGAEQMLCPPGTPREALPHPLCGPGRPRPGGSEHPNGDTQRAVEGLRDVPRRSRPLPGPEELHLERPLALAIPEWPATGLGAPPVAPQVVWVSFGPSVCERVPGANRGCIEN